MKQPSSDIYIYHYKRQRPQTHKDAHKGIVKKGVQFEKVQLCYKDRKKKLKTKYKTVLFSFFKT